MNNINRRVWIRTEPDCLIQLLTICFNDAKDERLPFMTTAIERADRKSERNQQIKLFTLK